MSCVDVSFVYFHNHAVSLFVVLSTDHKCACLPCWGLCEQIVEQWYSALGIDSTLQFKPKKLQATQGIGCTQ